MGVRKSNQIRSNFISNIITLGANIAVGLYYTPFLVDKLGVSVYGILPLALIINQYISVVTTTLTSAFTRFYSVSLQQGKYDQASKNISTSLVVILIIIAIITPVVFGIIEHIKTLFTIPSPYVKSARILFAYTILSFFCSMMSSLFNVTLYALNRLDIMNWLKIIRVTLKLIFVIILFQLVNVDIKYVGLANLMTESLILLLSIFMFYKYKPPEISVKISNFNKPILFAIFGMSVWTLIHQCGDTLLYRIDNLIVNSYWGIELSGRLGAISELGSYIQIVVAVIGSLFGPLVLIAYSQNRHAEVQSMATSQSFIVGSLSAILAGVIAGFGIPILNLWLGPSFADYHIWLTIKLIVIPFYAAGGILAFVYRAWNRVKIPALLTVMISLVNISLLIVVSKYNNTIHIVNIILWINTVFAISQCYVLNVYCVSNIYHGIYKKLAGNFLKISAIFIATYLTGRYLTHILDIQSFWELAIPFCAVALCSLVLVFFCMFDRIERRNLIFLIK